MEYSLGQSLIGDWQSLVHTLVVGTLSYFGLIVWLRISGKRTLAKWNSFDFAVTIALGSIMASALLTKGTAFLQAMLGVGLLVGLQFVITWLSVRSDSVKKLVKTGPTLLLFEGRVIDSALKEQRVAKGELLAAIRLSGNGCIEDIGAIVLENEGSFSIIKDLNVNQATALRGVKGFKESVLSA